MPLTGLPVTGRPRRVVALALALVIVASGCGLVGGGGGGSYKLIAYFPRAVSLYATSNVRVLGLPSGTVDKIEVIGDRVKVTMTMNKSAPVPQNVHAQIVPQSLIGERYIQLFPAWKEGLPQAEDGHEIGKGDAMKTEVVIPVEPDEALAALNDFLKSLDPQGLGRLITNLSDDLQGNGSKLNHALESISGLVTTFADKDQQLVSIVDSFDRFTTTLRTRETQLGDIIRTFSSATQVLADERQNLQRLLASLASLSENALDLVVKHSDRLNTDIEILTRLAQSIDANLGAVGQLLDAGPMVASGIIGAYDPVTRSFNLRTQLGPIAADILNPILNQIGIQLPCLPIDTACTASLAGQSSSRAVPTKVNAATTPIDDLLGLVSAPTARPAPGPSAGARVADGAGAFASFLQDAAASLVGAS